MLTRPTTLTRSTVPRTGRTLVEPDSNGRPESVRRVTILLEDDLEVGIDVSLDAIARTRGFGWGIVPASSTKLQMWLLPQQYINAISREAGVANCTVVVEYFSAMPGEG